ncbi:putative cyclase superfamily [Anopheles sinensis]|uniref:Putative cyclase superfamily n=1 Tax=Anopheles sinensis TaxID=74873 RepID=A0A084VGR0_ANOSI|nr:putative cyclase superfamily [Anopheles sinensis]
MPKPRVVKSAPADKDKKCVMSRVSQKVSEQEGVEASNPCPSGPSLLPDWSENAHQQQGQGHEVITDPRPPGSPLQPCDGPTSARQRRLSGETAPTANSTAFDAPESELGELLRRLEAARGEMAIVSQRMEGLRMRVPNALECDGGDRTWRPPSDRMANPFNANKMVSLKPPSASQSQMHEEMLRMEEVVERFRQDERKRIAMKFGDQPPHTSTNPGIAGAADYNPPPWERTIGGSMERGRNFHPRADEPEEWRSRSHAMTGLNTSQMAARQTHRELTRIVDEAPGKIKPLFSLQRDMYCSYMLPWVRKDERQGALGVREKSQCMPQMFASRKAPVSVPARTTMRTGWMQSISPCDAARRPVRDVEKHMFYSSIRNQCKMQCS